MEEEVLSRKKKSQCWQSLAPYGQGQHGHCAAVQAWTSGWESWWLEGTSEH